MRLGTVITIDEWLGYARFDTPSVGCDEAAVSRKEPSRAFALSAAGALASLLMLGIITIISAACQPNRQR
jgi:hypothetical protein